MDKYYVFLYDQTRYGTGKKAEIRNIPPKYGFPSDDPPVSTKVVVRSIFNYSKQGYKFTIEFE